MAANANQSAALIEAVRKNNIGLVDTIVKAGVDVNIILPGGMPLIHLAIYNYHTTRSYSPVGLSVVEYLLKAGANINVINNNGHTPLTYSAHYGLDALAELLLANGADPNMENQKGQSPLLVANDTSQISATAGGRAKVSALLFANGADPNSYTKEGDTLLVYALRTLNVDFANLLKEHGADPNKPSLNGELPLTEAIKKGEQGMIEWLLAAGANPLQKGTMNGQTYYPIYVAIQSKKPKIINMLVEASPPTITEFEKITGRGIIPNVIIYISNDTIIDILRSLIQKGLDVNYVFNMETGFTGLLAAAGLGFVNTVRLLLENGADVMQHSKEYTIPIMLATNPVIREMILAKMPRWEGIDRDDVDNKFVSIFEREKVAGKRSSAENMSMCPICLNWIDRESGCMFMTHNCLKDAVQIKAGTRYTHMGLYKKYKKNGLVVWCTICGRICGDKEPGQHRHFPKTSVSDPAPTLIDSTANPFGEEADCIAFGGGGYDEKLARYRTFLRVAQGLESQIGVISQFEAYEKIAEACWNPSADDSASRASNLAAKKFQNIKNTNFVREKPAPPNAPNTPAPNIKKPIPLHTKELKPHEVEDGFYDFLMDDPDYEKDEHNKYNNPVLEIPYEGGYTERVTLKTLRSLIGDRIINPDDEAMRFGYCFIDQTCMAKLYPSDIQEFVDDATYEQYRTIFNEKFRGQKGGRRGRRLTRRGARKSVRRRKITRRRR